MIHCHRYIHGTGFSVYRHAIFNLKVGGTLDHPSTFSPLKHRTYIPPAAHLLYHKSPGEDIIMVQKCFVL